VRKPEKTIEKLKSGQRVVIGALGDSLTYGWMVRKGYLDFWREMVTKLYPQARLEVINAGIPGDTAEGGRERLKFDLLSHQPDCILVQFALNDAYQGYSLGVFERHIRAIIQESQVKGKAEVILVTSVHLLDSAEFALAKRFYDCLEKLANEYDLPIARVHEWWKKKIDEGEDFAHLVQYDGVHPTERGYELMAEAIAALFY